MKRLFPWFYILSATGFVVWIGWTSPTVKECLTNQYENYGSDPLQEKIGSFYGFLVGSRLCVGDFIHENGEGIIAIFTVILGIATWFLWRATRNLVEDARITGTNQLEVAKISANAAKTTAESIKAAERARVFVAIKWAGLIEDDPKLTTPIVLVKIRNHGKTAAPLKQLRAYLQVVTEYPTALLEFPGSERELPPGWVIHGDGGEFEMSVSQKITKLEWENVLGANDKLICVGKVVYLDIYEEKHETGFCWQYVPTAAGKGGTRWDIAPDYKLNCQT